jgi:RimJ/RimL family protein N-acetyltransferase
MRFVAVTVGPEIANIPRAFFAARFVALEWALLMYRWQGQRKSMGRIKSTKFTPRTGETCILRSPANGDAKAILELGRANLRDDIGTVTTLPEFTLTLKEEKKWIADHNEKPTWLVIIAEVAGKVVGMINFRGEARKRLAHHGTIGMGVHRDWRGKGIGEALLSVLLKWAEKNPRIEKVCLAVLADNEPAIALYKKLGFVEEGRRFREIKFGPGKYVDDFLMYKWVK